MSDDFYSVAIPEPTTILGLRLRPLSLGHVVILHRLKSAYVTEGEPETIHDLALSVLVCSLSYQDGISLFNDRSLSRKFHRWHRKLTGTGLLTFLGLRKPRIIDYAEKSKAFRTYLKDATSIPNYSFDPSDFRSLDCPSVQIVKVTLMRDMGFSESELMDRSWALCIWDFVTLRAISGQIKLVSSETIKKAQEAAESIAEMIKEGKWPS